MNARNARLPANVAVLVALLMALVPLKDFAARIAPVVMAAAWQTATASANS